VTTYKKSAYLHLHNTGLLQERIDKACQKLNSCTLCPRQCRVNRMEGETGFCRIDKDAVVASYSPHFGEESPLVGTHGSGTIFFCGCNLRCLFCQNYNISHHPQTEGTAVDSSQLASFMVELQTRGCHNINFVTPSHVIPQIMAALPAAIERGLTIPLVYNSSGYDSVESLKLLDGVIDIYMPDFKFWDKKTSKRYAKAADYPEIAQKAIREMHRQVGDLVIDNNGLATRGMLFRHLVMPEGIEETTEILTFIAEEISPDSYVNIMDQYHPCGRAHDIPPLNRSLSNREYKQAIDAARQAGLHRLDKHDIKTLLARLGIS